MAEDVLDLVADRSVRIEQHVAQGFDFVIRAALVLSVEGRVEEGYLHLIEMPYRVNLSDLDEVGMRVSEDLGQPFDESTLGLCGIELLLSGVQGKLKEDTVVTLVVSLMDDNYQSVSGRQTFAIFSNLEEEE